MLANLTHTLTTHTLWILENELSGYKLCYLLPDLILTIPVPSRHTVQMLGYYLRVVNFPGYNVQSPPSVYLSPLEAFGEIHTHPFEELFMTYV